MAERVGDAPTAPPQSSQWCSWMTTIAKVKTSLSIYRLSTWNFRTTMFNSQSIYVYKFELKNYKTFKYSSEPKRICTFLRYSHSAKQWNHNHNKIAAWENRDVTKGVGESGLLCGFHKAVHCSECQLNGIRNSVWSLEFPFSYQFIH